MAQNLDLVNEAYAAFGRGDLPALLERVADDVEWSSPKTLPHGGTFTGTAGVLEFFQGIGGLWETLTLEVEAVTEAGPALVVAIVSASGTRRSGGAAGYGCAHAFTIRDGKIAGFREFVDLDTPLTA